MSDHIPLALQTAYRDLLDRHLRRPTPRIEGSVLAVENNGGRYWVAKQRIGATVIERRIGPDTADIRAQADDLKRQNEALALWSRDTAAIVAQLRAARMPVPTPGTGKLINALARAKLFSAGGVLAGTHAFGLYAMELGYRLKDDLALTEDVDIAADRSVDIIAEDQTGLVTSLENIGLTPVAGPLDAHPVRWQTADGVVLDVLTPLRRKGEAVVLHKGLGLWAQALPFLDFSLRGAVPATVLYREGILVQIPAPERYAVHKLLVASARIGTYRSKSAKDLSQAATLIAILAESRPYELASALEEARTSGPTWRKLIDQSLELLPATKKVLQSLN